MNANDKNVLQIILTEGYDNLTKMHRCFDADFRSIDRNQTNEIRQRHCSVFVSLWKLGMQCLLEG